MARTEDIKALLRSIKAQEAANYELIYVIEREPMLVSVVQDESRKLGLSVNIIFTESNVGLPGARNLGVRVAQGEIIGFVDDDVTLAEDWSKSVESTSSEKADAVGLTGPVSPVWIEESILWLPKEFDWLIGCTGWYESTHVTPIWNCWGMNMAFRRRRSWEIGGFLTMPLRTRGMQGRVLALVAPLNNRTPRWPRT